MNTVFPSHRKLIDAAVQHLALERAAACAFSVPDTDPPLYVAVGTAAAITKLLEIDQRAQPAGYLTDAQIAAGAAVKCEHGQAIGRNVAIDVFDAMTRAGGQEGGAA